MEVKSQELNHQSLEVSLIVFLLAKFLMLKPTLHAQREHAAVFTSAGGP